MVVTYNRPTIVLRGPQLSPRNHQPAVETTAGQQNPTFVGFEEKRKENPNAVSVFFLNPTKVGFRALAVVSTARQLVIRGPSLSPRNHTAGIVQLYCTIPAVYCSFILTPPENLEEGVTLARRTTRQYTQTNRNQRCSCFSRHCCWRTCRCKHPQTHRRWGC